MKPPTKEERMAAIEQKLKAVAKGMLAGDTSPLPPDIKAALQAFTNTPDPTTPLPPEVVNARKRWEKKRIAHIRKVVEPIFKAGGTQGDALRNTPYQEPPPACQYDPEHDRITWSNWVVGVWDQLHAEALNQDLQSSLGLKKAPTPKSTPPDTLWPIPQEFEPELLYAVFERKDQGDGALSRLTREHVVNSLTNKPPPDYGDFSPLIQTSTKPTPSDSVFLHPTTQSLTGIHLDLFKHIYAKAPQFLTIRTLLTLFPEQAEEKGWGEYLGRCLKELVKAKVLIRVPTDFQADPYAYRINWKLFRVKPTEPKRSKGVLKAMGKATKAQKAIRKLRGSAPKLRGVTKK